MRRRRGRRSQEEVELNLAAMLDMAFQLLAFFVMSYRPPTAESQITLRLPPPLPITTQGTAPPGEDFSSTEIPRGVNTLVINVFSDPSGSGDIKVLAVGTTQVGTLTALDHKLQEVFSDTANPFEQVILQVSPDLRYEKLMDVIDVCTRQKLGGQRLSKLSFVEAPTASGG
ncbi:MAG: ExbD/TolR family protein [Thermoguttaceae bacterium]